MSTARKLRCVMAQLNLVVGDVEGNTSRIIAATNRAREELSADVVMVPELAVSGYPPEDLLFHSGMRSQVARSIGRLKAEVRGITLIAGYPEYDGDHIFNSALVVRDGAVLANHRKACLPNYRVFDEKRYFTPGTEPTVVELNGIKAGILVCEDVWGSGTCVPGARCRCPSDARDQRFPLRGQQAKSARERRCEGAGWRNRDSAGFHQSDRWAG